MEVLETAEDAFDGVAEPVGCEFAGVSGHVVDLAGDHRGGVAFDQQAKRSVAVVGAAAQQALAGSDAEDQVVGRDDVACLAGRELKHTGRPGPVHQQMDLVGRPPRDRPMAWSEPPLFCPPATALVQPTTVPELTRRS